MKKHVCFFPFSPDSDFADAVVEHLTDYRDFTAINLYDSLNEVLEGLAQLNAGAVLSGDDGNSDAEAEHGEQAIDLGQLREGLVSVLERHVPREWLVQHASERAKRLVQSGCNVVVTGLQPDDLFVSGTGNIELILIEKNDKKSLPSEYIRLFNRMPVLSMLNVWDDENAIFFMDQYLCQLKSYQEGGGFYGAA